MPPLLSMRIMGIDAFAFFTDFGSPNRPGNMAEPYEFGFRRPHSGFHDFLRVIRSLIHHCGQDTSDFKVGIDLPAFRACF
jgi:hypothetical protein